MWDLQRNLSNIQDRQTDEKCIPQDKDESECDQNTSIYGVTGTRCVSSLTIFRGYHILSNIKTFDHLNLTSKPKSLIYVIGIWLVTRHAQ